MDDVTTKTTIPLEWNENKKNYTKWNKMRMKHKIMIVCVSWTMASEPNEFRQFEKLNTHTQTNHLTKRNRKKKKKLCTESWRRKNTHTHRERDTDNQKPTHKLYRNNTENLFSTFYLFISFSCSFVSKMNRAAANTRIKWEKEAKKKKIPKML